MPGSSRPSRNSSEAPPPVEMCVKRDMSSSSWTAATESPPPTTTAAPSSTRSARKRAMKRVPSPNVGTSNTPSGPFQRTVRASLRAIAKASSDSGPTSTADHEFGIFRTGTILCSAPRVTSFATTTSVGRRSRTPRVSALAMMRSASSTRSRSSRLLPTVWPCATRNVFAMPPPMSEHVDALEERVEDLDLVGDLGAADDRGERARRVLEEPREVADLALHQEARRRPAGARRRRPSRRGPDGRCRRRR